MEFIDKAYLILDQAGLSGELPMSMLVLSVVVLMLLQLLQSRAERRRLESENEDLKRRLISTREEVSTETKETQKKKLISDPSPETTVSSGLTKTRTALFSRIREAFSSSPTLNASVLEALEAKLISSDLGVSTTKRLLASLKERASAEELGEEEVFSALREAILHILSSDSDPRLSPKPLNGGPRVVLVVGVNGVGKTTTIGKLSYQLKEQGAKVLLGACDTFRAAAVEQMEIWAKRAGVGIVSGEPNAKPSTVAYQAVERAKREGVDVLLLDTAGRLHTRVNLMNELGSVIDIVSRELPGSPHETLLVLDATTGQNALQQARVFDEKCKLTGVIVSKLDGTPKGGMLVAVKQELGVPVRYIGVGESMHDLKVFNAEEFVSALFSGDAHTGSTEDSGQQRTDALSQSPLDPAAKQIKRKRRERANEF